MHIHSDSVIYMFNTGLFAVIEKQLHSTCLYSSIKKLVQQMRNCNVKQWSPAASVLQRGFYRCRSISLVLSRSRFLSMAHGKPSARAPTQRACGHLVPPTPPPTARGPTGLSLSLFPPRPPPPSSPPPPQNNAPSQWRTKLGRVSPEELSFRFPPASSLNGSWRRVAKRKKAPLASFFPSAAHRTRRFCYDFPRDRSSQCFSARAVTGRAPTGSCSGSHRSSCPLPSALGILVAGTEDSARKWKKEELKLYDLVVQAAHQRYHNNARDCTRSDTYSD